MKYTKFVLLALPLILSCHSEKDKKIEELQSKLTEIQNQKLQEKLDRMTNVDYSKYPDIILHDFTITKSGTYYYFVASKSYKEYLGTEFNYSGIGECGYIPCNTDELYKERDGIIARIFGNVTENYIHVIIGSYADASKLREGLMRKNRIK